MTRQKKKLNKKVKPKYPQQDKFIHLACRMLKYKVDNGSTVQSLAAKSCIHPQTIYRIRSVKTKYPRSITLQEIVRICGGEIVILDGSGLRVS